MIQTLTVSLTQSSMDSGLITYKCAEKRPRQPEWGRLRLETTRPASQPWYRIGIRLPFWLVEKVQMLLRKEVGNIKNQTKSLRRASRHRTTQPDISLQKEKKKKKEKKIRPDWILYFSTSKLFSHCQILSLFCLHKCILFLSVLRIEKMYYKQIFKIRVEIKPDWIPTGAVQFRVAAGAQDSQGHPKQGEDAATAVFCGICSRSPWKSAVLADGERICQPATNN